MIQFKLKAHPKQRFSVLLNRRRVSFQLWYSLTTDRWSLDLSVDDKPVLHGRRIVTGIDLLEPFRLGIGIIIAFSETGAKPDRNNLPSAIVGLFHTTREEVDAAVVA